MNSPSERFLVVRLTSDRQEDLLRRTCAALSDSEEGWEIQSLPEYVDDQLDLLADEVDALKSVNQDLLQEVERRTINREKLDAYLPKR